MTQEMKYDNWFLIHSGMKKPVNPTKGGFLLTMQSSLSKAVKQVKVTKPTEKPKEVKKEVEKGSNAYEKWFYRNCDDNNIPDLAEVNSHDYEAWFSRHCIKRAPEPKYSSPYEAWFYRNCDNRNIPDLTQIDAHDYLKWFEKHSVKRAPCTCDKSYAAWFERNSDSKNPGVEPEPVLTYEEWFSKHCTPSDPIKYENVKHEPYEEWFERHSKKN